MINLVIDRERWARGEGLNQLLNTSNDSMCCLGFLALECGIPRARIADNADPEEVPSPKWPDGLINSDGYPDTEHGVVADFDKFFAAVREQTTDTRFGDPSYLAAKFVVWHAAQNARKGGPLDFLGLGIVSGENRGENYRYRVMCSGGLPVVTWKEARNES